MHMRFAQEALAWKGMHAMPVYFRTMIAAQQQHPKTARARVGGVGR